MRTSTRTSPRTLQKKFDQARGCGPRPGARCKVGGQTRLVLATVLEEATLAPLAVWEVEETGAVWAAPAADWRKPLPSPPAELDTAWWAAKPRPGEPWRHVKGGLYGVVANAHDVRTGTHLVVYRGHADHVLWARPVASWFGWTDLGQRFTPHEPPRRCA